MKKNITLIISISLVATLLTGCNNVGKVTYKKSAKPVEYAEAFKENWNKTNFSEKLGTYDRENNHVFDVKNDLYVDTVLKVYGEETISTTYEGNKKGSYLEKTISNATLEEACKYDYISNNVEVIVKNKFDDKYVRETGDEKRTENSTQKDDLSVVIHVNEEEGKLSADSYDVNRKLYSHDEGSEFNTASEALTSYCLEPLNIDNIWKYMSLDTDSIISYMLLDMEGINLYVDGNKLTLEQKEEFDENEEILGNKVHSYMNTIMVEQYQFSKNTITYISYMYIEVESSNSKDGCEEKEAQITEFLSKTKITLKNVKVKEPNKNKYTEIDSVFSNLDL